jgi:hypothetical protein
MSPEQFDALMEYLDAWFGLVSEMRENSRDAPRVLTRTRELVDLRKELRKELVSDGQE